MTLLSHHSPFGWCMVLRQD